jgi:hypothetical protein
VYGDLLVWDRSRRFWQKFRAPERTDTPVVRYDARSALWRNDTLVVYGGAYRSVVDAADVWTLNTSRVEAAQLVKADPESE